MRKTVIYAKVKGILKIGLSNNGSKQLTNPSFSLDILLKVKKYFQIKKKFLLYLFNILLFFVFGMLQLFKSCVDRWSSCKYIFAPPLFLNDFLIVSLIVSFYSYWKLKRNKMLFCKEPISRVLNHLSPGFITRERVDFLNTFYTNG